MGEEHHVRGAPRIPPLVVVVSVLRRLWIGLITNLDQVLLVSVRLKSDYMTALGGELARTG